MVLKRRLIGTLLTCGVTLVGCETPTQKAHFAIKPPLSSLNAKREAHPEVAHAFQLLQEEKYKEASQFINTTLQSQPKSVVLHILNGLTYEILAKQGDISGNELAAVGYQSAINLDPGNVFAIVQLAKLKYNEKLYDQAQEHFANALLLKPNDSTLWHELAAASYYAYDIKTALSAIKKAEKLSPSDPLIHRSAAMIYAALGDFPAARKHFDVFQEKAGEDPAVEYVARRFDDWESLYKSGRIRLAAAQTPSTSGGTTTGGTSTDDGGGDVQSTAEEGESGQVDAPGTYSEAKQVTELPFATSDTSSAAPPGKLAPGQSPQIIIDCYMLSITETASTTKGNNILENLAVTFNPGEYTRFKGSLWGKGSGPVFPGGVNSNIQNVSNSGYKAFANPQHSTNTSNGAPSALTPSETTIGLTNRGSVSGQIFTAGISWAGLTYNLNIANAVDQRTEVVSRPSLMTFLNKPSVFFSGRELASGLVGQFSGTIVRYPVGVTLQITPQALEADMVTLDIAIEGSIIADPDPDLQATVDTQKTRIDTFAKVRLGETLMLGGIYERAAIFNKSGFPGLQDIPIVQYFFSKEQTQSGRRSIVFMLTPRSPDAVKAHVDRAMTREAIEPHVNELVVRNPDWFNTHSNMVEIFQFLSRDPIVYYEFRSGDILPPSWGWEIPLNEKLQQLASFLYF